MKKYFILIFLISYSIYSQTGINYQALLLNPNAEELPGQNLNNLPLINTPVCVKFSLLDNLDKIEYQETQNIVTDEFGMINTVIGTGITTNVGYSSFDTISWENFYKSLIVEIDLSNNCNVYKIISKQFLTGVPYSFKAKSANNVTGIVAIANGGTGSNSIIGAKNNLGLNNVNNTSDLNKPISTATQAALNLKEDMANKSTNSNLGNSDVLFPTQNAVKNYVDNKINISSSLLEIVYYTAIGDTIFKTPETFIDINKIWVYRNGIKINVIRIDSNTVKLENNLNSDFNDEIKIIQFK